MFDEVCLTRFPIVVADTTYSSLALPRVEMKEAGKSGRHMLKLNGMLRTRVAEPGLRRKGHSRELTENSHDVRSTCRN